MNAIRKLVMACALLGGLGAAATAQAAAGALPDLSGAQRATAQKGLKRDAACTRCHDEMDPKPILAIYQTKHGARGDARTPDCQSCHGESLKHLKGDPNVKGRPAPDVVFSKGAFQASDDKLREEVCLTCHKGTARTHWDGGQHATNGVACNNCHKVHAALDKVRDRKTQTEVCFSCHKEQRADTHKISTHPIDAGKVVCSDCHNPHGAAGDTKLLKEFTVNQTCYTCHADKRGPMLWEHQPVRENCLNCHDPHGSNQPRLIKEPLNFLCSSCHSAQGNNSGGAFGGAHSIPGGPMGSTFFSSALANQRTCVNCHSEVHGSNSPNGAYFLR